MDRVKPIAAMTIALLLAGCGLPSREDGPAHAGVPRPVGELRRVLVLPVVFEPGQCRWPEAAARLDASTVLFLWDWKGYQPVRAAGRDPASARLAAELAAWQRGNPDGGPVPDGLGRALGTLARTVDADGVLVVHAAPRCGGYVDQALQAATRAVPGTIGGVAAQPLSAAVYDAERGAPAWQRQITPRDWVDPPPAGPSAFEMQRAAEELFHPIDNALPAVLGRPATLERPGGTRPAASAS